MGGKGDDIINGHAGADMITGGEENDSLTGADADTFVYRMGDGHDTIVGVQTDNFGDIIDLIDISSLGPSEAEARTMINAATFARGDDDVRPQRCQGRPTQKLCWAPAHAAFTSTTTPRFCRRRRRCWVTLRAPSATSSPITTTDTTL